MHTCSFINKQGKKCDNKVIEYSEKCHIKSHYDSIEEFQRILKLSEKYFIDSTILLDNYIVIPILSDGACAYRCMAQALITHKQIIEIDETDETKIADFLQQSIREWIMKNKDMKISAEIDYTLEQMVVDTH